MAARADVAHIYANPSVHMADPAVSLSTEAMQRPSAIEWNISKVHAPDVWAVGFNGQGVVIGGQDTGYQWDHPALKHQYRGLERSGGIPRLQLARTRFTAVVGVGAGIRPSHAMIRATAPTPWARWSATTETGNQIGMAPGARWIGCRNMDQGNGTPTTYSECYQWFIAPTKLDGTGADPAMAPDVMIRGVARPVKAAQRRIPM